MTYMKAVCGRVKTDIENGFSFIDQFFDLFFVCNLGDQASGYSFFINLHLPSTPLLKLGVQKAPSSKKDGAKFPCYHLCSQIARAYLPLPVPSDTATG